MSVTPGPYAMPSSIRNGRAAAVPGSNTVSMCPMRTLRPPGVPGTPQAAGAPSNVPTIVSPYVSWR